MYISSKFRTAINFIEVFTHNKPDTCATIIKNSTSHIATLPTGHIGYIEVPITNEKPILYQVNDFNALVRNVAHTYHSDFTEPMKETNYAPQYTDDTHSIPFFSLHQVSMTNTITKTANSSLSNVQPTYDTTNPRFFLLFLILKSISSLLTNFTFGFLNTQIRNMLHFVLS